MKRKSWLLATVLFCALGVAATRPAPSTEFKRFVSPPLKDGTRYTFLYPARYSISDVSDGNVSMHDNRPLTLSQSLRQRIGLYTPVSLIGLFPGDLHVSANRQDGDSKSSHRSFNTPFIRFASINNARSKYFFDISHNNYTHDAEPFAHESQAITDSFQLLRPGAPTPALETWIWPES